MPTSVLTVLSLTYLPKLWRCVAQRPRRVITLSDENYDALKIRALHVSICKCSKVALFDPVYSTCLFFYMISVRDNSLVLFRYFIEQINQ